jgi:hypothetical protein
VYAKRSLVLLAAAAGLVLTGVAAAKGPLQACGANRCAMLGSERFPPIPLSVTAKTRLLPPATPAPYFVIRFRGGGGVLGYWIPSAGLVRLRTQERAAWITPTRAQAARLRKATGGIAPKQAPVRFETVELGYEKVEDPTGWLSLYSIGTPVASSPGAGGWMRIFAFSNVDTPWSDGVNKLAVSRRGAYLRRDGQVVSIPAETADRIRARLPLA